MLLNWYSFVWRVDSRCMTNHIAFGAKQTLIIRTPDNKRNMPPKWDKFQNEQSNNERKLMKKLEQQMTNFNYKWILNNTRGEFESYHTAAGSFSQLWHNRLWPVLKMRLTEEPRSEIRVRFFYLDSIKVAISTKCAASSRFRLILWS
jgi:hypothetical protein